MQDSRSAVPSGHGLRRDLGRLQSYAALIGILVGAGIYKVTTNAYELTGPSVVLGYLLLAPVVLAAAIPYAAFQSTPLARSPGGDYAHIRAVFGSGSLAFLAGWLKLISYLGALAFLSGAMADYLLEALRMVGVLGEAADSESAKTLRLVIASAGLIGFWAIHSAGVRWFGRVQLGMCVLLGVSIVVLVVPGVFALELENLTPMFAGETPVAGFLEALPILFFAYAGFEAIAHSAAEVKDAERELPRVYLRGVVLTSMIFVSMSLVAVGVLSREEVLASEAQMADAAQIFLPGFAAVVVTLGGVMATATSVNATMAVPARLAITLGQERRLPSFLSWVHAGTGTPILGLTVALVISMALLWCDQVAFALNIAVLALLCVYLLHSVAFLCLGRRNPEVASQVAMGISSGLQRTSAWIAVVCMGALITTMVVNDVSTLGGTNLSERYDEGGLTAIELFVPWSVLGLVLFWISTTSDRRTDR